MHFFLSSPSLCHPPLSLGIHPTTISDSIQLATERAIEVLTAMSSPLSLSDRESLLKSATTSLSSKVIYTLRAWTCYRHTVEIKNMLLTLYSFSERKFFKNRTVNARMEGRTGDRSVSSTHARSHISSFHGHSHAHFPSDW